MFCSSRCQASTLAVARRRLSTSGILMLMAALPSTLLSKRWTSPSRSVSLLPASQLLMRVLACFWMSLAFERSCLSL